MSVAENYKRIQEQTSNNNVEIIAVTKYASDEQMIKAYKLGIKNFAESYAQDAIKKIETLFNFENDINWHFIGRLQKNKVKYVVGNFCLIHSVDSLELAEAINNKAIEKQLVQEILLQVNISSESTKAGMQKEDLIENFEDFSKLKNIDIKGLMTMAPHTDDQNVIKDSFLGLSELKSNLNRKFNANLTELSMGMSNDYTIAISCGATKVRIGSKLFGFKN